MFLPIGVLKKSELDSCQISGVGSKIQMLCIKFVGMTAVF